MNQIEREQLEKDIQKLKDSVDYVLQADRLTRSDWNYIYECKAEIHRLEQILK